MIADDNLGNSLHTQSDIEDNIRGDMVRIVLWRVKQILEELVHLLKLHGHIRGGDIFTQRNAEQFSMQSPCTSVRQEPCVEIHPKARE